MSGVVERLGQALDGRYRIERELGQGGMATVYLARDVRHDRDVAIKVLHPELGAALGSERFLAEIKTTARLQHPHVLPLLDSGEADGLLFYVMPFVAGETLRRRLDQETQLPVDDALRIAREVGDALGAAHAHGIVHRDIKPENILLQGGHALVADFGIALAVQQAGGARMTQTGLSLGTPQYMAPEQAMGEKTVDARADIYALGAVVYEMLTGEPPFTGASVQAIVARVLTEEPRPLVAQRKAVPLAVEAAVLRALEKLPADRQATAAEFVAALSAPDPTLVRRTSAAAGARTRLVAGTTVGAIALVAATWTIARRPATAPATSGERSLAIALPDSARVAFNGPPDVSGGLGSVALTRDGSRLAWVATGPRGPRLFERSLGAFPIREVPGSDGAYGPFFSPDGEVLAFFVGNDLRTVRLATGEARTVLRDIAEIAGGTYLSEGRILVARAFGRAILVAPSGTTREVMTPTSARGESFGRQRMTNPHDVPGTSLVVGALRGGDLALLDVEAAQVRLLTASYPGVPAGSPLPGRSPFVVDGILYWNDGDKLLAAKLDLERATITTEPVEVAVGVRGDVNNVADFAVADDGTIAFVPGGDPNVGFLAWIDSQGRVDTLPLAPATYAGWDISRDGKRLVTVTSPTPGTPGATHGDGYRAREVRVHDLATNASQRLGAGLVLSGQATWAADDRSVIATSRGAERSVAVVRIGADALQRTDTVLRGLTMERTAVSRDGAHALMSARPVGDRGQAEAAVTLFASDRGGAYVEVPRKAEVRAPTLTPDGRWVAYEQFEGRNNVLLEPFPADGRVFAVSDSGGYEPIFSAKGDRIYYRTGHRIMVASFRPGPTPVIGKPATYVTFDFADFLGRAWSVGADGRVLVKLLPSTEPQREIRVLLGAGPRVRAGGKDASR